jgi:hypothetical protein
MSAGIFLIRDDNELVELVSRAYDSEDLLQGLLARYPNLLAGDQIDPSNPRRWLLLNREMAVPAEQDGSGRWSLDHLLLDQDAVPTLVEVKRSTDTRIRREVVGQMLDYAANAVAYLPVESLRAAFEARCAAGSIQPAVELGAFLGSEVNAEDFWQKVKTNLQAGRIRLVFVADEIPAELRRIVEFLNQQMDPAEVLAVEIRQYVGGNLRSLIPRVFGQTEQAQQKKAVSGSPASKWTEERFFGELEARNDISAVAVTRRLLEWAVAQHAILDFGSGTQSGSIYLIVNHKGLSTVPIILWTYGTIEIQFQYMLKGPAFTSEEQRRELQRRLNEIPGVSIPDHGLTRRPGIRMALLSDPESMKLFIDTLDWVADEIRSV